MSSELSAHRFGETILRHSKLFVEATSSADGDTVVPTTPGWTVRELAEHLGKTHHWVAEILEDRITDPAKLPADDAELPADPQDWPEWLSDAASRAAAACTEATLEADVFNASGDERTGGRFWMQSVLNETVVHGYDGATAAGRHRDYPIDADVAVELIGNHLRMLTSPTWAALRSESADALRGDGETLLWRATDDPGAAWLVVRRPDGATWQPANDDDADVRVSGPARALLLLLTRRLPLAEAGDEVGVDGDVDLAGHWIENSAHVAD